MTSDDVLSMLKAAEKVIEEMTLVIEDDPSNQLAPSVRAVATIQRDFLKGIIS